jgi:NADH:ubiquinone reductase (H+-translocating)
MRVVVLGGGFGGVAVTRHLERLCGKDSRTHIGLVSRDNFFVISPLLFEACSGVLELRHCAQAIRPALEHAHFVEANVQRVDVDRQVVHIVSPDGGPQEIGYDQLVVALGANTNMAIIPGSENALTFKTMADALILRNQLIEQLERADVTLDAAERRRHLTVVIIGGGLVGVELLGELTAFADDIVRYYPNVRRDEMRFLLCEAGPRILPEIDETMATTAIDILKERGAELRTSTPVRGIEPKRIHLDNETIEAGTVVLAAGIAVNAAAQLIPVNHDSRGRIVVDGTMRSQSHPNVWAVGDCAAIPGPEGHPYPALAQHAIREARQLAQNLVAAANGKKPVNFVYRSLGTMVALGHTDAVAEVMGMQLRGFIAWWVRRTYYLFQMPRWDRRFRIMLDWTVALFFRPDITKVDLTTSKYTT